MIQIEYQRGSKPYLKNDLYERITNSIVDLYLMNPEQISHSKNEKDCNI
jgi:phenylpyruvate tautomerase PptA (4-oxalocrotonate tautomerase family)